MTEPKPTVNQHFQNNDPLKPAQSARMQTAHGRGKETSRGPRAITIQRSSAGFGFTLRHFIVYPPDSVSDCPEEWQRGMSAGLLDPMGPMDTIFVKHIRENGPAVKAGLNTGDQVVSVNGESVMCKSYAEVVGMIQKSGPTLNLVVLPKEHDILQQCFADTAHNPHTNARPAVASPASQPEPQVPGVTNKALMMSVTNHQQPSAGLVMDANALLKTNIMSHLPRPKPYQSFQVEAKKPQQQSAAGPVHPAAVPLPRQSSSGSLLQQQQPAPPRILSPLVAGTGTVTSPPSRSSEEAQARLAAAAALVSKSVRKSADFAAATSAGSRASFAEYPGGSFDTASKRSSYAGTPTSRSEFILSGSHPIYSQPIHQNITSPYGTTAQGSQPSVAVSQSSYYPLYESTHVSSPSLHNQHRDSITSSKGSLGEEQQQRDVMTRIKKSFEQKEEFLKRPALPYWVNVQESNQVAPAVPREFYAQPQKFNRPIWPPSHPSSVTASVESLPESPNNSSSSSSGKTTGITTSFMTSVEPWSMVFTASKGTPPPVSPIGLVTNTVPKPFYGSANATGTQSPTGTKLFVSTLSKIHENIPSSDVDQQRRKELEIKPRISNAAPLASPEEFFTPSPTKSTQHPLAAVIKRAKQIECEKAKQAAAAAAAAAQTTSPVILRAGKPVQIEVKLQQPPVAGSGNRTVIIGSSKLHCEPPPHDRNRPNMAMDLRAVDDPLARPFSPSPLDENSNSSSPKVVAAAVHHRRSTPRNELTSTATLSPSCLQTDIDDVLMMDCLANTSTNDEQELGSSLNRSGASSTPITSDFELSVLERFDQLLASLGTGAHSSSGAGSSAGSSSTINGQEAAEQAAKAAASHAITASVNRRQKIYDDDSDRGMRRVSYLKATANPMDGTETSTPTDVPTATPAQATPTISDHAKGSSNWALIKSSIGRVQDHSSHHMTHRILQQSPPPPSGMISRLRQYFEEKSRPIPPVAPSPVALTVRPTSKEVPAAPSRRPHPPHSIQKLRSLFGDKVATSTTNQNGNGKENLNPPSPPTESIHSAREGWLHVKQTIVDCRRSTDRSWRQLWTRIRSGQVSFYREKPLGNGAAPGPDDMVLDLRNCSIEVAIYYTKKKHVLRLSTSNGLCEYLLQCEDNNDMVHWLDSFQQEQMTCSSDKEEGPSMTSYSSSEMMLVRQAHEIDSAQHHGSASQRRGMGRFTLHRNRSPTGHSPVSKTRKPSLSSSVYHSGGSVNAGSGGEASPSSTTTGGNNSNSSHKPATWRRKVVQQFKKIQGNSASYSAGGQYGGNAVSSVPEGATIGVPLEFCPRSSLSDSIPLIVELCVGIVEARGLESVGVYRVPGNSVAVNSLTESLNKGFDCLNTSDPRWNDVNVISSLMKSFFRKLPDPLVTSEFYGALIEASRTEPEEQRLGAIKRLVDDLPEPHYSTLRYLIGHLSRVAAQSAVNKMEARNLAIVFGPTLIRPGDDSTVTMVTDMSHQCRIVETLIDKVDYFFPSTSELDQADASITQQTSASTAEERKEAYAREIVSSIISAARKKKHSSLDSPNLSDRNGSDPLLSVIEEKREIPSGSAHSLVELGSTGGTPALPVEASEFRETTALQERKRSASLGGETALPPPTSAGGNMGELTGITELSAVDGQSCSTPEFRSRTSSGTFVPIKVPSMPNPIDAAGIRSYSGLSAVTQERIRLFEQETKALLQRDLVARQRREGDPLPIPSSAPSGPNSRVLKTEVDPNWNRSKLEMETDEFLDALEDHPSGKEEEEKQGLPALMEADHLDVDTVPATEEIEVKATVPVEPVEDDPVSTASSTTENTTTSEGEVKKKEEKTTKTEVKVVRKNSGSKVPTKTPPVVAARSQVPSKLSGAAATNKSSESTSSRMPVKKPSVTAPIPVARTSITGRASAAPVAGRSRTVELGKVVGSINSKKPDPANRVVVRQMSSGALLPTTSSAANKMSKTAPPSNKLRMKSESPKKSVVGSTSTKNSDELKIDENSLKSVSNTTPSLPESNLLSSIVLQSKENRPVKEGNELGQPELLEEVGKVAVKRAVEGKDSSRGVKRSDSLTKDEKTENNTKEKERSSGRSSRRFIQRGETGLKRRHTVGGTRDFDKVRIRWLADGSDGKSVVPAPRWSAWDRLQPLISDEDLNVDRSLKTWMRSERMRTSSPELCRRSDQAATATPLPVPTSTVE